MDIEQKARELLAEKCRRHGYEFEAYQILEGQSLPPFAAVSLNAIVAALTPPEGYVLVPDMRPGVQLTVEQCIAIYDAVTRCNLTRDVKSARRKIEAVLGALEVP